MNESAYKTITVRREEGAIWVTLARPDSLNALDQRMLAELPEAVERALAEEPVAIVFSGEGRAFCAGVDLRDLRAHIGVDGLDEQGAASIRRLSAMFEALMAAPVVALAAVNGICVAGGLELVLACDLVIASTSASFGDGHVNYGLLPGGGSTVLLPRVIGLGNARRLLYTGEVIDAGHAERLGLVNWLVPDDELHAVSRRVVQTLAQRPADALGRLKRLSALAWGSSVSDALLAEREEFTTHLRTSPAVREGLQAFDEHRRPDFHRLAGGDAVRILVDPRLS